MTAKEIIFKLRDVLKLQFAEAEEVKENVTETEKTETETVETVENPEEKPVEPTVDDRLTVLETSIDELKVKFEEMYNFIQDIASKVEKPEEEIKEEIREEVVEQMAKTVPSAKPVNETASKENKKSKTEIMVDFIRNFKK